MLSQMIKNPEILQQFEDHLISSTPVDFEKNRAIAESLLELARALGTFPPADPLEGIEVKIRLARILNCSPNSYKPLPKP